MSQITPFTIAATGGKSLDTRTVDAVYAVKAALFDTLGPGVNLVLALGVLEVAKYEISQEAVSVLDTSI